MASAVAIKRCEFHRKALGSRARPHDGIVLLAARAATLSEHDRSGSRANHVGTFLGRGMLETPNIRNLERRQSRAITEGSPTNCWALMLSVRALQPGGHRFDRGTLHVTGQRLSASCAEPLFAYVIQCNHAARFRERSGVASGFGISARPSRRAA